MCSGCIFFYFLYKQKYPSLEIKERREKEEEEKRASVKADRITSGITVFLKEERDATLVDFFDWETNWTIGNVELKEIRNMEWNWAQCRGKEAGIARLSDVIYQGGRCCWIPREAGEEACSNRLESLKFPKATLSLWHGWTQGGKWKYIAIVSKFWVLIGTFSHLGVRDVFPTSSA